MIINLLRSGTSPQGIIYILIIVIFALTISFAFHEFMHAAVAVWLGDPTPRNMGRLTLNPLAHLDPMGTVLLLVAGFGWGKPVMYNPSNLHRFKSRRLMNIMVHLAGVTGNLIIAYIAMILMILFGSLDVRFPEMTTVFGALTDAFYYTYVFSMSLLAFNLLPIPPLDGFHVLEELLPYKFKASNGYRKFQQFAPMILLVLFLASSFGSIPVLSYLMELIQWPFNKLIEILAIPFTMLFQLIGL